MKRLQLIILFGLLTNSLLGQTLNYKDYFVSGMIVFSKIDSDYVTYYLKELNVKSLTETKFYYDSLGNIKDSSIVNYYGIDSAGRIIEHRYDYRLYGLKGSKYRSLLYSYAKNGKVITHFVDPHGPDAIFDDWIATGNYPMNCEYFNRNYQIETINIKPNFEGETYTMRYSYNQDLFVEFPLKYLISGLDFLKGNQLLYRHKISYTK